MKKQALRTFTMLSLVLMLTAVSVYAQSERSGVLNIKFNFIVGGKTLPAGEYIVEPNRTDSHNVWLVQSKEGNASALFTTMPVRANQTQEETRLVFHKYGDQYFLSQIWTPGGNTGRELLMPRVERELAKSGLEREKVVVTRGEHLDKNDLRPAPRMP
jgi:ABC-type uncharacterized transport system permease subunit